MKNLRIAGLRAEIHLIFCNAARVDETTSLKYPRVNQVFDSITVTIITSSSKVYRSYSGRNASEVFESKSTNHRNAEYFNPLKPKPV
jgi:hypothetical protein